jgi:hypothetical protein
MGGEEGVPGWVMCPSCGHGTCRDFLKLLRDVFRGERGWLAGSGDGKMDGSMYYYSDPNTIRDVSSR